MENLESIYLIEYKKKVIGVYNNYSQAELFILSCLQNNLMTESSKILTYKINSCYCLNEQILNMIIKPVIEPIIKPIIKPVIKPVISQETNDINTKKLLEASNQKIELQHKINMLKIHKEKIKESKNIYENDIKLYDYFIEEKQKKENFTIPELFIKKYNIIQKLKEANNLSWESFTTLYVDTNNNYNDYFLSNSYDEMFINSDCSTEDEDEKKNEEINEEIDEEIDIESDSSTEDTETEDS